MENFLDKYMEDLELYSDDEKIYSSSDEDEKKEFVSNSLIGLNHIMPSREPVIQSQPSSSIRPLDMYSHEFDNLYPDIERMVSRPPINLPVPVINRDLSDEWDKLEKVDQPEKLNIKLFPHQRVSVYDMEKLESTKKIEVNDSNYYVTDFGILGDMPGYGKGLSVVSLILRDRMPWDVSVRHISSSIESYGESLRFYSHHSTRKRVKTNFVLASPNLIEQWKDYFAFVENGTLAIKEISTRKDMEDGIDYKKWDVVIVSSARYNELMSLVGTEVVFKRFIFDDASSTFIPQMAHIRAGFTWFVTATYQNLMCVRNKGYLRDFFRFFDNRILRHLVIKNPDDFCKTSFKMPDVIEINHRCANPRILSVLKNHIDAETQLMLSAGDVKGAISRLGAGFSTSENLIEIVSRRHKDKLEQAYRSLQLWQSKPPCSTTIKEIEMWTKRVSELEKLIKELNQKYKEILNEECTICCEPINVPTMMKCCQNIFCGNCIINCLKNMGSKCPMCRSIVNTKELIYIASENDKKEEKKEECKQEIILPKQDKTVEIIKKGLAKDPNKKFLIFSSFDESFHQIRNALVENSMKFAEISGTKASRDLKIKNYKDGKVPILFLNSNFNGAGINLQTSTDIILYHEMPPHIRTQNIGRAMRIGRTEPLTVHNLKID